MKGAVRATPNVLLCEARRARGWSQEELAHLVGTTALSIHRWECGLTFPRAYYRQKLCDVFSSSPEALGLIPPPERRARQVGAQPRGSSAAPQLTMATHGAALDDLPVPLNPLIGRERDTAALAAYLRASTVRLVTLTGTGGVGKTHLALAVAHAIQQDFADGAVFVSLAHTRDEQAVVPAIAQALGVREVGAQALPELLRARLRPAHLLLVLDNCEHLLDPLVPLVARLLAACPRLTILATSRAPLRITGEQHYPLEPLGVPAALPAPSPHAVAAVAQCPAVMLFVHRARQVAPAFALSAENVRAVATICRQLDGLPLALELAAAQCGILTPQELLGAFDGRRRLRLRGARDLPARQQTLFKTLAWSYELLPPDARAVLRRVAVCARGCPVEAVAPICAGAGALDGDVDEALATLVDYHLLSIEREDPQPVVDGADTASDALSARVRMLETVREYAQEQLRACGEWEATARAHAGYYLRFAARAEPQLEGPAQRLWFARVEREHDNFRAALGWARERGEGVWGACLAVGMWKFWYRRGYLSEGRRWLEEQLAREWTATGEQHEIVRKMEGNLTLLRAKAINAAGVLAERQGAHDRAATWFAEGLALRRALGDTRGVAFSLNNLGSVAMGRADYLRARDLFAEALALAREIEDTRDTMIALSNLGEISRLLGDIAQAREYYEAGLALCQQLGDTWGGVLVRGSLGELALSLGDVAEAVARFTACLEERAALGDSQFMARALAGLAEARLLQGRLGDAAAGCEEACALLRELGDSEGLAHALLVRARVLRVGGDDRQALACYQESLAVYQAMRTMTAGVAAALEGLAEIAMERQEADEAARILGAAAALRATLHSPLPPVRQRTHREMVERVRQSLGTQRFDQACAAGATMPIAQLIADLCQRYSTDSHVPARQ